MTIEMELYISLKRYLKHQGWSLLGGQPPSGTDHLPLIEIKNLIGDVKGSKSSFKPDLVAYLDSEILVVEIKPRFSPSDLKKLQEVSSDVNRQNAFWSEIQTRDLKSPDGTPLWSFREKIAIRPSLCFRGEPLRNINVTQICETAPSIFSITAPLA